jgi:hypothetical protein
VAVTEVRRELSDRDMDIMRGVAEFLQLSMPHIRDLYFRDRSHSIADAVVGRLVRLEYLARVGRRRSQPQGGAGAWVYQLGRYGRAKFDLEGRGPRNVNDHALMVADTLMEFRQAERDGLLRIKRREVELPVQRVRADLFMAVDFPAQRRDSSYFLEIDRGNESKPIILDKIAGYWQAYTTGTDEFFPYVVFVVPNVLIAQQVRGFVRAAPEERQEMVRVFLLDELIAELMRL